MNKGAALRMICEKKEIRKEDTIAFGDQEPDIPMLEAAGAAIATVSYTHLTLPTIRLV